MVQLKTQISFVKLKFDIASPSLSDCLERIEEIKTGLAVKGIVKCVSKTAANSVKVL